MKKTLQAQYCMNNQCRIGVWQNWTNKVKFRFKFFLLILTLDKLADWFLGLNDEQINLRKNCVKIHVLAPFLLGIIPPQYEEKVSNSVKYKYFPQFLFDCFTIFCRPWYFLGLKTAIVFIRDNN